MNRSQLLGLMLISFGALFALFSYYIEMSIPLTVLGLASIILGAIAVLKPSAPVATSNVKVVDTRSVRVMLESACANVEALLEEFNATHRAIYFPKEGRILTFIPLSNPDMVSAAEVMKAPIRLITSAQGSSGLLVSPPASEVAGLTEFSEGSSLEEAVKTLLVDAIGGAVSVNIAWDDELIFVEIVEPRIETAYPRFRKVLGALPTSIAACALTHRLGRPVIFEGERVEGQRIFSEFRLI